MDTDSTLDELDQAIVRATQAGLPLAPRPYHDVAELVGAGPEEVMQRMQRMLERGVIRRIGAVPDHYAVGYIANGMSVWDVDDAVVDDLGEKIAHSGLVSHCYLRRRHPPLWPYNLFAMVHGRNRAEVEDKVRKIAQVLGAASNAHEVLYSSRILKKTGLRLS
ncbi:MAG TPA: AsnC family transcriptional regulator [Burkholderiales bacterium]|nr:AsnC family transcriptional regulator [Burkholderiales bacterium]